MDSTLADQLFKAYRVGLLLPSPTREYQARSFDFLFKQVFCLKVPVHQRVVTSKIWRLSSEGLRLAREGRLEEASRIFHGCWAELARAEISQIGMLLATAPLEAAHAYLEYKCGDFARARARILNAMEADLELENDDDFGLLEMHRIQAAQNLMRIDLRSGEPRKAIALAAQLLAYTEGFIQTLPVHRSWMGKKFIANTPPSIRRLAIPQIALDVAIAFSRFPATALEDELLENLPFEDYLSRPHTLHERFRLWLLAKQCFQQGDWDRYIQKLLEFLPAGRADIGGVWYSAVLDLLELCRTLNSQASLRLQERILRDARKWPGLPGSFRERLALT